MGRLRIALATSAALVIAAPASAALVLNGNGTVTASGNGGGSVTIAFDGYGDNPGLMVIPNLTSTLKLDFISSTGTAYTFGYTLTNTSTAPQTGSRVSIFGFNTDPNRTGGTVNGDFDTVGSGNVPNFPVNIEFCAKDGGGSNNCAGGGNGGAVLGDPATGQFTLTFGSSQSSITLSDFVVRYQQVNSTSGSAIGRQTAPVPEPGTWAMMLLGFGAVGFSLRSARRQTPKLLQIA
jgi:hypothetical protein